MEGLALSAGFARRGNEAAQKPGTPERRTHNYYRHGTSSLFAGLLIKTGVVIGQCHRRHRHQEFIKFLKTIDDVVKATEPKGTAINIVLDYHATHKTPAVQRWLKKHPEYHMHFTPTIASRLNQVERVFADLTQKQLRRGVFTCVVSLERRRWTTSTCETKMPSRLCGAPTPTPSTAESPRIVRLLSVRETNRSSQSLLPPHPQLLRESRELWP